MFVSGMQAAERVGVWKHRPPRTLDQTGYIGALRVQDPPQMIGMIVHSELAPYDFGHAAAGPKLGGETRGEWTGDEQLPQPLALRRVEFRLCPELRIRQQRLLAALPVRFLPTLHARQAHAQHQGDARRSHSLPEELDGHAAADDLVRRGRGCTHATYYGAISTLSSPAAERRVVCADAASVVVTTQS